MQIKDVIDGGAKIVGIGAAASVCFAFTFNAGYFAGLENGLAIQHLTIADHITTSIRILPFVALFVVIEWALLHGLQRRAPPIIRKIWTYRVLKLILAGGVLAFLLFGRWHHAVATTVVLVAVSYVPNLGQNFGNEGRRVYLMGVSAFFVMIISFALGLMTGNSALYGEADTVVITKDSREVLGRGAFFGERFVLLVATKNNRMLFIPRDTIQRLETIKKTGKQWAPFCAAFGIACRNTLPR